MTSLLIKASNEEATSRSRRCRRPCPLLERPQPEREVVLVPIQEFLEVDRGNPQQGGAAPSPAGLEPAVLGLPGIQENHVVGSAQFRSGANRVSGKIAPARRDSGLARGYVPMAGSRGLMRSPHEKEQSTRATPRFSATTAIWRPNRTCVPPSRGSIGRGDALSRRRTFAAVAHPVEGGHRGPYLVLSDHSTGRQCRLGLRFLMARGASLATGRAR
jgi:hypothetical protein